MKKSDCEKIVKYLHENFEKAELHEDYSGRGMFGEKTCAVEVENPSNVAIAMKDLKMCKGFNTDNLGFNYICY